MSTPTTVPNLTDTYGAAMVGLLVTCFLSGIMTLQTHLYFQRSRKDHWNLKLLVATVWTIDMIHLGTISGFVYHFVISNWGNQAVIGQSIWELGLEEMLNTWITFIVQMFFIHRINVLSKYNRWTLIPLYLLAFIQLGFGTGGGIKSMLPQTVGHLASTRWRAAIWLISGAVNDILIASILCYYLWHERTVMSQRLVDQLIAYAINTGLLTSILAFIDIGCFIAMPGNYIHLAFNFVLGRVYTNSLLASLNMRERIRRSSTYRMSTNGATSNENGTTLSSTQIAVPGRSKITINTLPLNQEDLAADGVHFYGGKATEHSQIATQHETLAGSSAELDKYKDIESGSGSIKEEA
ncbi:hypothetical protein K439DRAFT_389229 [Ramaria rubella]|nr:hypothetical protein K439DRAFT_389229 [Ramaria rubella]